MYTENILKVYISALISIVAVVASWHYNPFRGKPDK
jgi:hypothetical protein